MLDKPRILRTIAQQAAIIRLTIPRDQIRQVMGPAIQELMAALAAQGVAPAGPRFAHHLNMDLDIFDFEIGVTVTAPVAQAGRVTAGLLAGAMVARAVFHGGYEGLGAAWGEFNAWITAEGHTPGPDFWECYITGPESNSDSRAWRTELNRPLTDWKT